MGIQFRDPSVPWYASNATFHYGLVLGLFAAIGATFAVDKLGNFMYRRGYAKPFFVFGKRLHHVWIYALVPFCYVVFSYLVITGYIHPIWNFFWYRLALLLPVVGLCLTVDFIGDSWKESSTGIIRHEWVYALIPAYILAFVVNLYI
jgi:ABC-type dipeptide/oligopeptide/nickel transport system permease component